MELTRNTFIETMRQGAWKAFKPIGFPTPKTEEYRHIPITQALNNHFSTQEQRATTLSSYRNMAPYLMGEVSNNKLVFVNGIVSKELSTWEDESAKPMMSTLREAAKNHPQLIDDHLGKYEDKKDPFALFNTAQWQDGIVIRIPKNTTVQKPVIIHHLHDAQAKKVAAHPRLLVIAEPYSQLTLIEKTDSIGSYPVFSTLNEEIVVQQKAALRHYNIQDDKGSIHKVTNTYIHQSHNSEVTSHVFTLSGKMIRNNLHVQVDGTGCKSNLYGLYLLRNTTLTDNHTSVDHREPGSTSNEHYKGVMNEKSRGIFNGKIYVRPRAQQTNAFQSNQNILLSATATLHAKPQLEIWADDVKCSHGCTSGQLDNEALFYLQSRGLSKSASQALLLKGFANEIMDTVADESLKNFIYNRIADELSHHDTGL